MSAEAFQKFIVFLLYGSLIFQSYVILINPMSVNKKANFFFGLFLFFWSSYWLLDVLELCQLPINKALVLSVSCVRIFTPIFLYFSVIFFINPNYKFKASNLFCLIVPTVYITLLLVFYKEEQSGVLALIDFIDILHNLPYIIIVYFKIKRHQKKIQIISSNTENINLQWLIKVLFLLLVVIFITVFYELYNAFIYKMQQHIAMDFLFLVIVYIISFHTMRQKEIYPTDKAQRKELLAVEEEEMQTEKKKLILDSDFEALKLKLIELMHQNKPYLDGELNLLDLAKLMNINAHQLSYLINSGFNINFFQFVNGYRVAHAKELLLHTEKKHLSFLGIAYESGFNSKTSFNTIFKKMTGETPSAFQKKHSSL